MQDWDFLPGDLVVPFIFVPHGEPEPTEWMAAHPGWVKFPATFVPRPPEPPEPAVLSVAQTVAAGAAEGAGAWLGANALAGIAEAAGAAATPLAALSVLLWPFQTAFPDLDEVHPGGRGFAPTGVSERLLGLRRALAGKNPSPGTDAYNHRARPELEKLQNDLRQLMTKDRRLTQNAVNGPVAQV